MNIFAVVPVYNEETERLISVLKRLKNFVDEIVVVDDGSTDYVSFKIFNFEPQILNSGKKFYLLRHEINRGQGAALQTGTDLALKRGADIIIHFDSDGQHNAEDIPALIQPIKEGKVDFVFGSRFLGKISNMPWSKKNILQPIARLINFIFTGLKLSDAHNGMRAFSFAVADKIYLNQDRMAHATEIMYLVKKNKIKYTEVPVKINYNQYGQGIGDGMRVVKELIFGKILQ